MFKNHDSFDATSAIDEVIIIYKKKLVRDVNKILHLAKAFNPFIL